MFKEHPTKTPKIPKVAFGLEKKVEVILNLSSPSRLRLECGQLIN